MCMQQLLDEQNAAKRTAALLGHPTVKRLAKIHPDARWGYSTYSDTVYGSIHISVHSTDPWDISALPDVQAGTLGYLLIVDAVDKPLKLRGSDTPAKVVVRIYAEQRYTEEEKDLLRRVGKLTRITETSRSYEALTCQ